MDEKWILIKSMVIGIVMEAGHNNLRQRCAVSFSDVPCHIISAIADVDENHTFLLFVKAFGRLQTYPFHFTHILRRGKEWN